MIPVKPKRVPQSFVSLGSERTATMAIEARDVVRDYGNGRGILGVSLAVRWGEVLSVIGANGAGKTCLLRCLLLLDSIGFGGIIRIAGETWVDGGGRCTRNGIDRLRGRILGAVFQQAEPWPHRNVLENVMLPLRETAGLARRDAKERAEESLEALGVLDRADATPDQLSGGLRQRVVLARALALRPRILLLDEATSALDLDWTERVRVIVRRFADEGGAVINVSHRLGFIRRVSDTIAYMEAGRIAEIGDPVSVLERPRSENLRRFIENA